MELFTTQPTYESIVQMLLREQLARGEAAWELECQRQAALPEAMDEIRGYWLQAPCHPVPCISLSCNIDETVVPRPKADEKSTPQRIVALLGKPLIYYFAFCVMRRPYCRIFAIDEAPIWVILVNLPEAGLPSLGSVFYVHLGLQIGTQFCPGMISNRKFSSAQD